MLIKVILTLIIHEHCLRMFANTNKSYHKKLVRFIAYGRHKVGKSKFKMKLIFPNHGQNRYLIYIASDCS